MANFLKTLTETQKAEVAAMAAELKKLSDKLGSFRMTEGDNHGCIEEAMGFASAAAQSAEELLSRTETRRTRPVRG